jgi:hypothetical protein
VGRCFGAPVSLTFSTEAENPQFSWIGRVKRPHFLRKFGVSGF